MSSAATRLFGVTWVATCALGLGSYTQNAVIALFLHRASPCVKYSPHDSRIGGVSQSCPGQS